MNLNGEQILEFIPEPALVIDNAGIIISVNEFFLSQYVIFHFYVPNTSFVQLMVTLLDQNLDEIHSSLVYYV